MTREFLQVTKRIEEIRALYATKRAKKLNALIMGNFGTGKTWLTQTCPRPILLHSFDPGGSKTRALQPLIQSGDLIVDNRFEIDNRAKPQAWTLWEEEFELLHSMNLFDHLGTYVFDGLTSAGSLLMNEVLKRDAKNTTGVPQLQDYMNQQIVLVDVIRGLMALPCNVIVTGHIGTDKDEVSGRMVASLFISGKLVIKIPLLFDELYIAQAKGSATGTKYSLLTQNDGLYQARTRIGGGIFEKNEAPNIRALLKKAGYEHKDKPSFKEIEKVEGGEKG